MIVNKKKNGGPKKIFWFLLAISIMLISMVFTVCSNRDLTHSADLKSEYYQEPQEKSISTIENEHEDYRSLLGTTESADLDNDNEMEIVFGNSEGYVYGVGTEKQAQENEIPRAFIDSISPSDSKEGEYVTFIGHGIDEDGDISEYLWESDMDGFLSNARSFTTPGLSEGTHVISLRVRDDGGDWSEPVQTTIVVEGGDEGAGFDLSGIFEDPLLLLLLIIVILVIIVAIVALLFGRKGKEEPQVRIGGFDNLGTRSSNR